MEGWCKKIYINLCALFISMWINFSEPQTNTFLYLWFYFTQHQAKTQHAIKYWICGKFIKWFFFHHSAFEFIFLRFSWCNLFMLCIPFGLIWTLWMHSVIERVVWEKKYPMSSKYGREKKCKFYFRCGIDNILYQFIDVVWNVHIQPLTIYEFMHSKIVWNIYFPRIRLHCYIRKMKICVYFMIKFQP